MLCLIDKREKIRLRTEARELMEYRMHAFLLASVVHTRALVPHFPVRLI